MKEYTLEGEPYKRFTGPQKINTAVNTLYGILEGITIDNELNAAEIAEVLNWVSDHGDLLKKPPLNNLGETLEEILEDKIIDHEEKENLLWVCNHLTEDSRFYDLVTNEIQQLEGILHGILADDQVSLAEAKGLYNWIDSHSHLKGMYPYDEIDSLLTSVLKDGKIDEDEQKDLQDFFSDFVRFSQEKRGSQVSSKYQLSNISDYTVRGICAACPEILFDGKVFTFTGKSEKGSRNTLAAKVATLGGKFSKNLTQETEFLVIGTEGNDCWAFTCYGRKVEKAVELRKSGHPIIIVHETDFWDAIEDQ